VNKLKSSNSPTYSDELYNLAFGPIHAELFSGCNVNGVKFLGVARDDKLCTQNSGVHVPGGGESTDIDFYGKLTTVVQLLYKDRYQVILFKCRWFDTNPHRPGSVKIDHGLLSVKMNRTWYDDDPYILANMATQIVYLDDPKAGSGWNVVQKMDRRNVYAVPELDPTDNDVDNVADQLGPSNDDDVHIEEAEEEEEEDWETESDDSDDNENPAATDVERWSFSAVAVHRAAVSSSVWAVASPPRYQLEQDHVLASPGGSQAPASSASSVVQPISARRRHRPATITETTSTDCTGASGAPPAKRNTRGPCRQLKTTKVTRVTNSRISIAYDERHRAAPTAELHSSLAHDIGHVVRTHCPMQWKSWKVIPNEIKLQVRGQLSTNYHLEDLTEESMAYVNRLFGERYKQWKSDLHHHFQAFDDPEVALQEGCPKELEGREDSWAWLCAHFQAPDYVNKAQVNKGNRKKKTLLHHSGSRPFSYRMDARRRGGSKFPEIDVFGDVYVRPGNELAESLHTTMVERSQLVLQESASQLPPETPIESVDPPQDAGFQILTETLDQTLGRRPGTYCRGMGNARQREPRPRPAAQSSQVTALTAEVATLRSQMSVILESLARSGIPVPQFDTATSEPVRPEHPQQTTAPAQTSEPHVPEDNVDFSTLLDF
ncbi:unnamed protein product, partial [Prunus brigantina]